MKRTKITKNQQIALNILNDLGGIRFQDMTGAKEIAVIDKGVRFKIGRNATSTNLITIKYDEGKDLYNMFFEKLSIVKKTGEVKLSTIKQYEGLFNEDLSRLFTEVTGLHTTLWGQ